MQAEYEQICLDFDAAPRRIERLAESVYIIKALFRGEAVSFVGEHYRLTDHRLYPLPVQRPHPPLLIGSNGREGLSLAAREASIVGLMGFGHRQGGRRINLSGFTDAATRERIKWIREAAESRFANLELNVLVQHVIVTDDAVDAAAVFLAGSASLREAGLSVQDLLSSPFILIGSVDELDEEIRARRERLGISYLVVFEKDREAFGPVLGRLTAASA